MKYKMYGIISLSVMSVSLIACYYSTLQGLYHVWINDGDYSYALLIPLITGYLIWERRKMIVNSLIKTNWIGGSLFLMFLMISAYGILGSSPSAVRSSIPFMILSITLFCAGMEMFKILAFPLSLLFLMIPMPTMLQAMVGVPLKRISTRLGEWILRLAGVSVFVEGNIIDMGITKLQVVDACSGLRYILPLLTIGILFAYFFEKNRWRRIILAIATIPLSIIINGIRIGFTGILAQYFGSKVADGFFHGFSGWIVFMFAFAFLFIFHRVIKFSIKDNNKKDVKINRLKNTSKAVTPRQGMIPVIIVTSSLLSLAIFGYKTAAFPNVTIKKGLSSFPLSINEWKGSLNEMDPEMVALSGAEESFDAVYRSKSGDDIFLYIGYRGSPFSENENFFHSPSICLPASGWRVLSSDTHEILNMPEFKTIRVRRMTIEKFNERCLVYYWFQTNRYTAHDVNLNRWHLTLHALTRDNTHDLFIRLISPIESGEKPEATEARVDEFTRSMTAALDRFLSDNQIQQGI
ncbi:VPLPA-CTERM-specific exosortase XrtD [bacterium]|nr:VPLPA-CTERM-specific exosortase XrtD [bacterium]